MWLMTKYGFFSAVADKAQGDKEPVLKVRARCRQHLVTLNQKFNLGAEIIETFDSDYQFRIIIPRSVWATVAGQLAAEIDYGNFKGECDRAQDGSHGKYASALHRVWHVMLPIQPLPPYSARKAWHNYDVGHTGSLFDEGHVADAATDYEANEDEVETGEMQCCPNCDNFDVVLTGAHSSRTGKAELECEGCGTRWFDGDVPEVRDETCPNPKCGSDLTIIGEKEGKCVKCGHLWSFDD